jgi:hypothetical protein
MRFIVIFLFFFLITILTHAQLYLPSGNEAYHAAERAEIKTNNLYLTNFHSSNGPYTYESVLALLDSAANSNYVDSFNAVYLKSQAFLYTGGKQNTKPFLKNFYRQNAALYSVITDNFKLSVNPVVYFAGAGESGNDAGAKFNETLYINTRGAELQGIIDNKISFYAYAADNQMRVPLQTKLFGANVYALPGESYYKNFKGNGVDFFHAEGYVSAPLTKHISMQLGSSRQFIGDGIRSLIMSDFAKPHLFLKLNTRIWKIDYQNLFYELTDSAYATGAGLYKKKFGATHHISINTSKNFNIGFFETIIFKRDNNAYELNYLNPIIFYRAVEQSLGSPDNALLGLDYKWDIKHRFQLYGQLVFDEFVLANMRAQFFKPRSNPQWGWWGNKFAAQIGVKAVDLFNIKNLDIQLEYNHIRPYTFAYSDPSLSFTDFNQSMAHPLGSNLKELVAVINYQPSPKLTLQFKTFTTATGIDTSESLSYGGDLLKSSHLKLTEFGNATGQGLKTMIAYYEITASYRLAQQLYIDAGFTYRQKKTDLTAYNNQNQYYMLGLRLNASRKNFMY